jgi:hypothetical protein
MSAVIPQSESTKFSNLQLELLRLFSMNIPDEELFKIRDMIARHLLKNKLKEFDEQVKNQRITQADLEKWLNEES